MPFSTRGATGPEAGLFVMLGGVVTTLTYLLLQACVSRRQLGKGPLEG